MEWQTGLVSLYAPGFIRDVYNEIGNGHLLLARPNARVMGWFKAFLVEYCQVLPVTEEIARVAGEMRGAFKGRGIARSQADMLIAATARVNRLKFATRNGRDFAGCGIPVVNPFE